MEYPYILGNDEMPRISDSSALHIGAVKIAGDPFCLTGYPSFSVVTENRNSLQQQLSTKRPLSSINRALLAGIHSSNALQIYPLPQAGLTSRHLSPPPPPLSPFQSNHPHKNITGTLTLSPASYIDSNSSEHLHNSTYLDYILYSYFEDLLDPASGPLPLLYLPLIP